MQSLRRVSAASAASLAALHGAPSCRSEEAPAPAAPRVGLVGTGWALRVQRPRFAEAGLAVTGLYSRDLARARALAAEHGIGGAYDDVAALAAADDVDLVSVAGPAHLRSAHVAAALAAGKDVLVEKPVALDAAEAAATLARAEAAGARHFVDFELRCVPALRALRRRLDDLGTVRFVQFSCRGNFRFCDPATPVSHWNRRDCGGGVFSAVGTHYVDVVRWLFDDEVAAASSVQTPCRGTADGSCVAHLRLETRAFPVSLAIHGRTPGGARARENRLVVVGDAGTADFDFATSTLRVHTDAGEPYETSDGGDAWGVVGTRGLAERLRSGHTADLATLADGVAVQRATDAVHASAARGGAWVAVGADGGAAADLSLREVRERQAAFASERDWDQFHTPRNVALALVGEVGELAECFQWKGEVARGLPTFTAAEAVHVGEELADVLVYTVRLADVCGVPLEAAVNRKMAQNAAKYPADKARGRADKYTAYQEDRAAWAARREKA